VSIKKITLENWNQPDPASISSEDNKNGEYLKLILEPQLYNTVPEEVRDTFEVARATIIYGYYYYPLYTLGDQQIQRVGEAALWHKAKLLGILPAAKFISFKQFIELLKKHNAFDDDFHRRWTSLCSLRNSSSHAKKQSIYTPAMIIKSISVFISDVNKLFA
jgi:hypothetical protein